MAQFVRSFLYVVRVEERFKQTYISGFGKNAVFAQESTGWWATFDNHLIVYLGPERPDLRQGDTVLMTIQRVTVRGEQR